MRQARIAGLGLVGTLFLGLLAVADLGAPAGPLEGTWEVVSVHRYSLPDPWPVGATLTFAGDQVTLRSRVPQIVDGLS